MLGECLYLPTEESIHIDWELSADSDVADAVRELMNVQERCSVRAQPTIKSIDDVISIAEPAVERSASYVPENCSLEKVAALFEMADYITEAVSIRYDFTEDFSFAGTFMMNIPRSILNRIAASPDQKLYARLMDVAEQMLDSNNQTIRHQAIAIRARLLGYDDAIDYAIAMCEDPNNDPILADYDMNVVEDLSFVLVDYPKHKRGSEFSARVQAKHTFAKKYIHELLNISDPLATKIVDAMRERVSYGKDSKVYDYLHIDELEQVYEACIEFTPDETLRIHEGTGIVNFGQYSSQQLRRMLQFVDRDERLLVELRNRPVIVCVKDAMGDYNGALSQDPEIFEGQSATTLFFEISSAGDSLAELAGYADALREREVTYDTIVIAAHGFTSDERIGSGAFDLGNAMITADPNYVHRSVKKHPGDHDIFASRGLQKLFTGFVPNEVGEAEIILLSCQQGSRRNKYGVATSEVLADFAQSCMTVPGACVVYAMEESTNIECTDDPAELYAMNGEMTVTRVSSSGELRYGLVDNTILVKGLLSTSEREDIAMSAGDWAKRSRELESAAFNK